jgi:hypothetical protein
VLVAIRATAASVSDELWWLSKLPDDILNQPAPTDDERADEPDTDGAR